ncbi:MAG: NAD-dependent epimerase/dehydratase family protein [Rhodocyclaceae bacterium]|nr:NAD-dependent epimerase/dehydratase family protein [Rhodocyclaceae bacterium]
MNHRNQIVLGCGVLGRAVARQLLERGGRPRVLSRRGTPVPGAESAACDAADGAALAAHLDGPATLFICAAPPYWRWTEEFPKLVAGIEAACRGRDVRIVLADNFYACGSAATALTEHSPANPCSHKGEVRQLVANRLMALHGVGDTRTCVVRAADFFGPGVEQSCCGEAVVKAVVGGKPAYLLGRPEVPHAVTYIDDFARALCTIADDESAFGQTWHAPVHNLAGTGALVEALARQAGKPAAIKPVGPLMMTLIGLFSPAMRELKEMRYLFENPFVVSSAATESRFGLSPTPLEEAVGRTLAATKG